MNSVLLDTCALIWLLHDDDTLGDEARSIIEDTGVRKLLSPVSYWEVATKSTLPKYKGCEVLCQELYKNAINDVLEEFHIQILHFTLDHTEYLYKIDYFADHKDPFDRILVAKALIEESSLISSDGKLYYYGFQEKYKNVWALI
jgi:PIN domain nuclease of toxin-antitoxin system